MRTHQPYGQCLWKFNLQIISLIHCNDAPVNIFDCKKFTVLRYTTNLSITKKYVSYLTPLYNGKGVWQTGHVFQDWHFTSSGILRYLMVLPRMKHSGIFQNLSPSWDKREHNNSSQYQLHIGERFQFVKHLKNQVQCIKVQWSEQPSDFSSSCHTASCFEV